MKFIESYDSFFLENLSVAKQIVSLADNDSYAQNLLSKYCKNFDTSVDLVSIISLLSSELQKEILRKIKKYKLNFEEDPEVTTNTDLNLLESEGKFAGKNLFDCFLKILTALNCKNIYNNPELTPSNFIFFLITNEINYTDIREVSSRFKYLDSLIEDLKTSERVAKLYYGLRNDMMIEYGISLQGITHKIGEFNLKPETIQNIQNSNLLSLFNFKKNLKGFSFENLKTIGKVKEVMNDFNPGYFEKQVPTSIENDVLTFGYYGIGRWDDGFMDYNELQSVKNNLKNYLIQFPWSQDIKISVMAKENWVFVRIKLK